MDRFGGDWRAMDGEKVQRQTRRLREKKDMSRQPGGFRRRLQQIVATFREKGATSPGKAMTAQELGLPPKFEVAMRRRLGSTGIFVEVGGRYYLDEARMKEGEAQWGGAIGEQWEFRRNVLGLRMARMVVVITAVLVVLANIFFLQSVDVTYAVVALFILWVVLTAVQFYYTSKARIRMGGNSSPAAATLRAMSAPS